MNIVKLQRQLQSVPEQALVGYVQNPDGRVPSYLALTELSRRKQMREEYQKAAAPEKSVAESMVEEASGIAAIPQQMGQPMPQQMAPQMAQAPQPQAPMQMAEGGLAALSLPDDMFDEESYAGGGIVAFDEGGDTTEKRRKQAEEDRRLMKRIGYDTLRLPGGVIDILGGGYNALATGTDSILNTIGIPRLGRALGIYDPEVTSVALPKVGSGGPTPGQDYISSQINQMYDPQVPATSSAPTPQVQAPFPGPYAPNVDPVAVAERQAEILRANKQAYNSDPTANVIPAAAAQRQTQGVNTSGLTNPFRDISLPDRPAIDKEGFVGEAPTLGGIQALRKDAYKQAGVSEEVYDEMRKDIKDRLKDIPKEREDAVAHAMIMAGLGIAGGTSQNAIQNIAQGAIPAMTGFRSDVKELNNRRDKLAEREFAVMEAQNKFRQTGADSDLRELNDANKERRGAEREFIKYKTNVDEKYNDRAFQLQGEIAKADMDIAKTKIEASLKQQEIDIRRLDANSQDMYRKRPELFATIMDNLNNDPKYVKGDSKTKRDMIAESVLATSPKVAGAGSKGFTYMKELEAQFGTGGNRDLIAEYNRIKKDNGLVAAEAFKADYINRRMVGQPGVVGNTSTAGAVKFLGYE